MPIIRHSIVSKISLMEDAGCSKSDENVVVQSLLATLKAATLPSTELFDGAFYLLGRASAVLSQWKGVAFRGVLLKETRAIFISFLIYFIFLFLFR